MHGGVFDNLIIRVKLRAEECMLDNMRIRVTCREVNVGQLDNRNHERYGAMQV